MKSQRKKSDRLVGGGRRNLRNFVEKEFVPVEWVRPGVSLHEVKELREAFDFFDTEKTGIIDAAEVLENYRDLGFDESNARIFQIILDIEDPEKVHKMTFENFFQIMTENLNEGSSAENFEKMFRLIDSNSDG
jgi:Ca2+-binding EF-hand superfamily protein